MGDSDSKPEPGSPEWYAENDDRAYCTECHTWYNTNDGHTCTKK